MENERRQRLLTDADLVAIGEAFAARQPLCSLGLDVGDALIIKRHLELWKKATSIIGTVVLTTLAVLLVGIFTKGFWASLIEGVKR